MLQVLADHDPVLNPRSVAILGASDDPDKVGGRAIRYMLEFGFDGTIFPVNPKRSQIQGLSAYASVADLPAAPDLGVVCLPAKLAARAVAELAEIGTAAAIVMTSGYAETGEAGASAQKELTRIAAATGMRIIGPNAQGIANFATGAVANFSTMFTSVAPQDGPVAVISQSGAASVMPFALLRETGIGVRYLMATGNDADLSAPELLTRVLEDDEIRVVLLYLEAIRDRETLIRAGGMARERGVTLRVLKPGTSAKGAAAAASHTGALATEDRSVSAFFDRHGYQRATSLRDWLRPVPLLLGARGVGRGRIAALSHSGAVGVMIADHAAAAGLELPDFAEETRRALHDILPSFGTVGNPVDLTAGLLGDNAMFGRALTAIAADPNIDVLQVSIPVAGDGYDVPALAEASAAAAAASGKPVVMAGPQAEVRAVFRARGIPTYDEDLDVVRAIAAAAARPEPLPIVAGTAPTLPPRSGPLDEAKSLSVLAAAGIRCVEHRVCVTPEQVLAAFDEIGGPVVLKGCAAEVAHKSDHGLVHLGLTDSDAVQAAVTALGDGLTSLGLPFKALVARMERGSRELMVGARRDPVLGPMVVVGDGGVFVEVLKDVATLAAPVDAAAARRALQELRIWPILQGARGAPPMDVVAVCQAVVGLSGLMEANPWIESVDVNPLLVKPEGQGAVALDALVVPAQPEGLA
ncbi:acetate--CoA ligase family protein [Leisingera thetidis]|uniref:acetate--CoA ligase family protein n=1 Tax=Leisingera thetidis TaxID=2930199 RepID=UPI0021F79BED|nr:acetate--CoA ligase family protein [Leisingera thetidis]